MEETQGMITVTLRATSRNIVLGELYDSRTYLVYSSVRHTTREVRVRTLCEMGFGKKLPGGKV